jgi:hypothetical protein
MLAYTAQIIQSRMLNMLYKLEQERSGRQVSLTVVGGNWGSRVQSTHRWANSERLATLLRCNT